MTRQTCTPTGDVWVGSRLNGLGSELAKRTRRRCGTVYATKTLVESMNLNVGSRFVKGGGRAGWADGDCVSRVRCSGLLGRAANLLCFGPRMSCRLATILLEDWLCLKQGLA